MGDELLPPSPVIVSNRRKSREPLARPSSKENSSRKRLSYHSDNDTAVSVGGGPKSTAEKLRDIMSVIQAPDGVSAETLETCLTQFSVLKVSFCLVLFHI